VADYTPVYVQGQVITLTASAAVKGGDLLVVTGSGTVAPFTPGASPATAFVGVANEDTVLNGRVAFYCRGPVHESIADGTVTAGDQVCTATNANRQVRTLAAIVAAAALGATYVDPAASNAVNAAINTAVGAVRGIIGVALTTATDGNKVRWMLT
jgi:hypothetical protein